MEQDEGRGVSGILGSDLPVMDEAFADTDEAAIDLRHLRPEATNQERNTPLDSPPKPPAPRFGAKLTSW